MKLTIERKEFQARLADVCAVADKKSTQPVLRHFLLDANGQGRVTATDLETTLRAPLEAIIEDAGVRDKSARPFCLPAQRLYDIVRAAEWETIIVQEDGKKNWVHVLAGRSKYRMPALPAKDFPEFPIVKNAQEMIITAGELLKLLDRTVYAAATEQMERYTLQGVLFHLKKKGLTVAGCDGHNLAVASASLADGASVDLKERKYIIPAKSAKEFQKILSGLDAESSVTVLLGENHAFFRADQSAGQEVGLLEFVATLLEGQYPDYTRIIPKETGTTVTVLNGAFQRALERMALVHQDVSLDFKGAGAGGMEILLAARSPEAGDTVAGEAGEAEETFTTEEHKGPDAKVTVLAAPVLKALKAIGDVSVTIGLTDGQSPILLHSAEEAEAAKYKCVVMPRR